MWPFRKKVKWIMSAEEALVYKDQYQITSPAERSEDKQEWTYDHIPADQRVASEAQGCRVSRKIMQQLWEWFPDRDDIHSNKPVYTHRQMNQCIRAAIAQNYKRLVEGINK